MLKCGKRAGGILLQIAFCGADQQNSKVSLSVAKHQLTEVLVERKERSVLRAAEPKHLSIARAGVSIAAPRYFKSGFA